MKCAGRLDFSPLGSASQSFSELCAPHKVAKSQITATEFVKLHQEDKNRGGLFCRVPMARETASSTLCHSSRRSPIPPLRTKALHSLCTCDRESGAGLPRTAWRSPLRPWGRSRAPHRTADRGQPSGPATARRPRPPVSLPASSGPLRAGLRGAAADCRPRNLPPSPPPAGRHRL
jgi:hypothetical protein